MFKDYKITKEGKVISLKHKNEIELKGEIDKDGYRRVLIYVEGKRKKFFVHRLVAEQYIPNPENKPQVNHKDGNKLNNHYSNLEWVTNKENIVHAEKLGLRSHENVLRIEQVKEIKKLFGTKSMKELAEMYNVSLSCIKHIHAGHTWKNI